MFGTKSKILGLALGFITFSSSSSLWAEDKEEVEVIELDLEAWDEGNCPLKVVAASEHAVGRPCLTTKEFMTEDLKLSEAQIKQVQKIDQYLQDRGGSPRTEYAH